MNNSNSVEKVLRKYFSEVPDCDDDGEYRFSVDYEGADSLLEAIRAELPPGYEVDYTGEADTDHLGNNTADVYVRRAD